MKKLVSFTFQIEIGKRPQTESVEESPYIIMWEWFDEQSQLTRFDSGLIDAWEAKEGKKIVNIKMGNCFLKNRMIK